MAKVTREKFKTYKGVFDQHTERNLFKLITQGHFEGLESPISIGKEANIFSALSKSGKHNKVIIKIYRLENCDFNKMYEYIRPDARYIHLKKQKRKIIFAWAQREFRNLLKAREANVRCPTPIAFLDNILIIEYIGDVEVAPKLKDDIPENMEKFFKKVINYMKRLHKTGFVHGDLSEFNILNYNDNPVFIDFSQCTPLKNPNSQELLERDVKNIARFFNKIGLKTDEKEIIEKITN